MKFKYLFWASFFTFLLAAEVYAQELDATVEFTAQGQGYWVVMVNGFQITQHTAEREAYESATNQIFIDPSASVQVVHNSIIDVEAFVNYVPADDPEPSPPETPGVIEIPGSMAFVPVEFGTVKQFKVANDDYTVASDNKFLYVHKVGAEDVYLVHRPAGWYRDSYAQSETTALTDQQIANLIADVVD